MDENTARSNRRLATRLLGVVTAMFAFGFLLVPLYDVFCDITGLNGKTGGRYENTVDASATDLSREVRVQFIASVNAGMPWEFRPAVTEVKVHPGQAMDTYYRVQNLSGRDMVLQAVPSVTPGAAAQYLHKVECFCFQQQRIAAGESKEMPLRFFVDPKAPEGIHTLTLSYTLFNVTESALLDGAQGQPE